MRCLPVPVKEGVMHVSLLYTERKQRTSTAWNEGLARCNARDSLNVGLDGSAGSFVIKPAGGGG